ncbi:MAG: DNA-3-methyladenine glycosylase [Candidatus Tectomicrobia bacterium]|nr:DNA-3-methyladenine glycosylase [Candidatus Tectomicrobia bacterium]
MMPIEAGLTRVLPRSFFDRDPVTVARELLGTLLCCDDRGLILVGRIVETEAYLAADDPASHGYRGQTPRNAAMFGPPGHAYIYAMHRYHCLNVVTQGEGIPSAILLRAVEPLQGMEVMFPRRRTERYANLTSGPGKLCQAFGIDRSLDQWDLIQSRRLWLAEPMSETEVDIGATPRIGVTSARELPLRFCDVSSACLSRRHRVRD